ncbi:MAG: hypothetical protein AB7F32_12615 [Victivallaceae bacterium]
MVIYEPNASCQPPPEKSNEKTFTGSGVAKKQKGIRVLINPAGFSPGLEPAINRERDDDERKTVRNPTDTDQSRRRDPGQSRLSDLVFPLHVFLKRFGPGMVGKPV